MPPNLRTREDYVYFVEVLYFGAMQAGKYEAVLAHFAPGALLTGYAGDAPAKMLARQPAPGQSSLDAFMSGVQDFDLNYLDFVHTVDTQAHRIASYFTLIMSPRPDGAASHLPARRLRNCNFFQFENNYLTNVVAYFCNPGEPV